MEKKVKIFFKILSIILVYIILIIESSDSATESKGDSGIPPPQFFADIIENYFDVKDVVLSSHEDTNFPVTEYASSLYKKYIFTSVYEWKGYESEEDQFARFIQTVDSGKQQTIVFFLDALSAQIFFRFAHLVKEVLPLPCFYRWIFFDVNGSNVHSLHSFNSSAICWKSLYISQENSSDPEKWSVYGPTLTSYGNCHITDHLGYWSLHEAHKKLRHPETRITDFGNRLLQTAVVDEQPFYKETEHGFEGIEYELVRTLRTKLNFRILLTNRTDNEYGKKLADGTWSGFIGLIQQGEALFTAATLSISNRRMKAVDFSSPYLFSKVGFVVRNPALQPRKMVLIKPFNTEIWILLACNFIACTGALYLITHFLPFKSRIRRSYNIWFLLRAFGQQGTPSPAPTRYGIRFFISAWWLFAMLILWSYAGSLTSFMTNPGRRPTVDTVAKLRDALISRSIYYGTKKGTTYEHFLLTDMAKIHPVFEEAIRENPLQEVDSVTEAMRLVLKENYAFVYMTMIIEWNAATMGATLFRISKTLFSSEAVGVAIQKCHPCKKSFDHIINRLQETGFFGKWYDDTFIKATIRSPQQTVEKVRPLSLNDLQGAFYFGGIGLGFATVVFIAELTLGSRRRKKGTKRRKKRQPSIIDLNYYLNTVVSHF